MHGIQSIPNQGVIHGALLKINISAENTKYYIFMSKILASCLKILLEESCVEFCNIFKTYKDNKSY